MILLVFFVFLGLTSSATIYKVTDDEKGISHVQSGEPGVEVEGEYSFRVPEGDSYAITYTAGDQGFIPQGEHLPTHPQETEEVADARGIFAEAMRIAEKIQEEGYSPEQAYLPLYREDVAEVLTARQNFMEAYMKAVEMGLDIDSMENAIDLEIDNNADENIEEDSRRRRSATPDFVRVSAYQPLIRGQSVSAYQPLIRGQSVSAYQPLIQGQPVSTSVYPKYVSAYPSYPSYPLYAPQYPHFSRVSGYEPVNRQYYPLYTPSYPKLLGSVPVQTLPVGAVPVQTLPAAVSSPVQTVPGSVPVQTLPAAVSEDTVEETPVIPNEKQVGEDEPAALEF